MTMDYDTYVQTEHVRAAQARKPEQVVTSDGVVTIPRYAYVVEHENNDEFGNVSTSVDILGMEEFNARYRRLDWRAEDRDAAYNEGYAAGSKDVQVASSDDYERGWRAAVDYHDIADGVVRDTGNAPAPVGDKLETDGPVSKREDNTDDSNVRDDVPVDVPGSGRDDATT